MNPIGDEHFARYVSEAGLATNAQIDEARELQADAQRNGKVVSLGAALVLQGAITADHKQNVEKKLLARQEGVKTLGNFKLIKKLGEGGMGAVYLAEDTSIGRKVALKVLPRKHASNAEFVTRFRREAKATGKLNHVNIISAFTVGEEQGNHFYAMEFCEGEPLDSILKRDGCLKWDKALGITMQVARGLKHAHDHGFIHRDIKPANIFITNEGIAKILDLGLSKNIGDTEQSFNTQTGMVMGTPHYISPEQARGDKVIDGRTDIYSLGATLYHLITGQTPFQGPSAAIILMKHLNEQLPNPQDLREDIPEPLVQLIQKMMAKEPLDRYVSCDELMIDIELVSTGKPPGGGAIETGKSSVAMRQFANPRRAGEVKQTRKHQPVASRQESEKPEATSKRTKAAKGNWYLVLAALAAVILIGTTFLLNGSPQTPQSHLIEKPSVKAPVEPPPITPEVKVPAPPSVPPPPSVVLKNDSDDVWVKSVQALPAEEQVRRVVDKLKELNPLYDKVERHRVAGGNVVEFDLAVNYVAHGVTNISPVRVFNHLDKFYIANDQPHSGLADIRPLQGLPLTELSIHASKVSDLTPLKGMPLRKLLCDWCNVADLSPLRGMSLTDLDVSGCEGFLTTFTSFNREMPLEHLNIGATGIQDLSPLKSLGLISLRMDRTNITDLSPLKGIPLRFIDMTQTPVADLSPLDGIRLEGFYWTPEKVTKGVEILRKMETMKKISTSDVNHPALDPATFWKKYDAGEFGRPAGAVIETKPSK
jgi:serine/threonine protein kinase